MSGPMDAVARRLGTTPGQAWTLVLGLGLGVSLLATSLPPVLAARGTTVAVASVPTDGAGALTGLAPQAPAAPPASPTPELPSAEAPVLPPVLVAPPLSLPVPGPVAPLPLSPPPAPPPADPSPSPARSPAPAPAGPLRLAEAGFSTPDAATPALPPDGLPIGARLGAPLEISHVRLTGTGTVLTLAVDTASSVGDAAVRACPHRTADWKAGRPQDVVPFDGGDCVPGVRTGDAVSFNLTGFTDRAGAVGFALVVAPTTSTVPATFRLVLRPPAPGVRS